MNKKQIILKQLDEAIYQIDEVDFGRSYYQKHRPELCSVAHSPLNRDKNRYNHWGFPFDYNLIQSIPYYINASPMLINGQRYIAAQGPRNNTLSEFWQMVWAENVSLIVSVTNEREFGKEIKFDRFWPDNGCAQFENLHVENLRDEIVQEWADGRAEKLRQRQFTLDHDNQRRFITHLHMENWPDTGMILPSSLLALNHHALQIEGTMIVHCAAGVGRTGTFIAFHSLYRDLLLQFEQEMPKIDIMQRIKEMRALRWGAIVAEPKQYRLLIDALKEAVSLTEIL